MVSPSIKLDLKPVGLDLSQVFPGPIGSRPTVGLALQWVSPRHGSPPNLWVLFFGGGLICSGPVSLGLICRGFVGWVVVVMVEVDFLCCWWVEVDGVLLNLLAWLWVLAVGFCGFLLGFDLGGLRWVCGMGCCGGGEFLLDPVGFWVWLLSSV